MPSVRNLARYGVRAHPIIKSLHSLQALDTTKTRTAPDDNPSTRTACTDRSWYTPWERGILLSPDEVLHESQNDERRE